MGQWWALPLIGVHVGLQTAAYKVFGQNEKLASDIVAAPTVALLGAVAAGYTIDKVFRNKEKVEKVAMFFAAGGAAVAGAGAALAVNGEAHFDGIQSGALAIPAGEAVIIGGGSVGGAALGVAIGEALHKEKLVQR